MCNLYSQTTSADAIRQLSKALGMQLTFSEGAPNLRPKDVGITDTAPIVRAVHSGAFDLIMRRWSWPGPNGKPVYNFRSDGREFPTGRCLILADGYYEFTKPEDSKQKRKDRWRFFNPNEGIMGIAGLIRDVSATGEAFTMLTTEPGPDVAPYHSRQVAVLPQCDWRSWLDYSATRAELIRPLPAGTLAVEAANRVG